MMGSRGELSYRSVTSHHTLPRVLLYCITRSGYSDRVDRDETESVTKPQIVPQMV